MAVLTVISLLILIWMLARPVYNSIGVRVNTGKRLVAAILLVFVYAIAPLALFDGPYSSDVISVATLQEKEQRVGKEVRMERRAFQKREDGDVVITFAQESLRVIGDNRPETSSPVSLIGEFVELDVIRIKKLHVYESNWRDYASYIGLGLFFGFWLVAMVRELRNQQ